MLIQCPRCGFEQPKDQFCASCGLDIDNYKVAPKPFLVRLVQNPNLYLTLIGISIVLVIGYIIYSQRELVSRQMDDMFDAPVSSRDAGDPDDPLNNRPATARTASRPAAPAPDPRDAPMAAEPAATAPGSGQSAADQKREADAQGKESGDATGDAAAGPRLGASSRLEVMHWEVPREALLNLTALAERVTEGTGGRVYLFPAGGKVIDQIQSIGQRLSNGRTVVIRAGSQLTHETPATGTEAFQYALFIQVGKAEGRELGLKFDSQLVMPQAETPGEEASTVPAVRTAIESSFSGNATLPTAGLLVMVMDPAHRSPREEFLARAGQGPWNVFVSPEYKTGLTDWVITVQVK